MNCPRCKEEIPADARFCPRCGAPLQEAVRTAPARSKVSVFQAAAHRGYGAAYFFSFLGGLAIAAGAFFPWYQFGGIAARGYDSEDGFIFIGIGIVAAGLGLYGMISRLGWLRVLLLLGSIGALGLAVRLAIDVADLARLYNLEVIDFFGLGLPIIAAGALLIGISSIISFTRKRR